MPLIRITDELDATLNASLAPTATLLKSIGELPGLILHGENLGQLQLLKLDDPAVRALQTSLNFERPVSLGAGAPELTIGADAGVSFRVIQRTAERTSLLDSDDYGDNPEIPPSTCYLALGVQAAVSAGLSGGSGQLTCGMDAATSIAIDSYRPFPLGQDTPNLAQALAQCVGEWAIPAGKDDCQALPAGAVVTVSGSGSLQVSAEANLLAVTNPLATLSLLAPLPTLAVAQTGSVSVGASWKISAEHQVRIQKVDGGRVRLGWYRKRDSDFQVTASATAGIDAGAATGLLTDVISAISSNAAADRKQLETAGLSADQADAIEDAIRRAITRKLELALSAEWSALRDNEAAFLYEIDLDRLDGPGEQALRAALAGNLGPISDARVRPPGIQEIRSVVTSERITRCALKVNLLGIFNAASVSELALKGVVTYTASTGELVISDTATASRFQVTAVNLGADEDKLRHVMAESFLITAAYRGSRAVVSPPELSSSHSFFRMDRQTSRDDMRRCANIPTALHLETPRLPEGLTDFGRSIVSAEVNYDDAQTRALFLNAHGGPRGVGEYEAAGRWAIVSLVPPDGDDAFRLRPATDDRLWAHMKDQGPANFRLLFPQEQVGGVTADYLAIRWWADSMSDTAQILAQMIRLGGTTGPNPSDPAFQKLRNDLASHLREVAAKAHEQFGAPWGLVAMFLVSATARPAVEIVAPRFVYTAGRAIKAAA